MRIDRLDVDGFGRLSGSFHFPGEGVGLWAAPNESGKSTLAAAVVAALYGAEPSPSGSGDGNRGWIMLRFALDDGTTLVVARDLAAGRMQVTDPGGRDVTARYRDAERTVEIGERLLGLDREQFREVFLVRPEDLPNTVGNPVLLRLLRGSETEPPPPAPEPRVEPAAEPPRATSPDPAAPDDLAIVRSTAMEMQYFSFGTPERTDDPPPVESFGAEPAPEHGADLTLPGEDPDAPGLLPVERLRRLRQRLAVLDGRQATQRAELLGQSERSRDLLAEARRLEALAGAEPQDLERLRELVDRMAATRAARESVVRDEAAYRRTLEEREILLEEIQGLGALFGSLPEPRRELLAGFRRAESVRRGTRALTRSESRLDDARVAEISRAREQAIRTAVLPLVASAVGLFGSLATLFVPLPSFAPGLLLALGAGGALAGGILLARALRLRESERNSLVASQKHKQEQLEELEREERAALARLEELAAETGLGEAATLLERWELWTAHAGELQALESFARRRRELDHSASALRDQLGRFAVAQPGADPSHTTFLDPETIIRDYRRFFELGDEIREADARSADLERALAELETERAELRERIDSMLRDAGVDPDRELDEAIEIFALRRERGSGVHPLRAGTPESSPESPVPGDPEAWTSRLSARTEAILRRFLPEARDVEVDASLAPRLRFQAVGPLLGIAELARTLSSASLDQVCLALRLAIVETLGSAGERIPVFLDDPLVRSDDARHERALEFLVEDASARGQVVLLTAQEVRVKWFLHQFPQHRTRLASLVPAAAPARARESSASVPSPAS